MEEEMDCFSVLIGTQQANEKQKLSYNKNAYELESCFLLKGEEIFLDMFEDEYRSMTVSNNQMSRGVEKVANWSI